MEERQQIAAYLRILARGFSGMPEADEDAAVLAWWFKEAAERIEHGVHLNWTPETASLRFVGDSSPDRS